MTFNAASLKVTGTALLIFAAGVVTGSFTTASFSRERRIRPVRTELAQPAATTPSVPPSLRSNPAGNGIMASGTNRRADRITNRPPGWQRFEALRRLEDQIQLAPEQRDRIRAHIRESEQRIRSDWEPVVPRIQAEIRELRRRISSELNPEQRERFDSLFDRRDPASSPRETRTSRRTNSAPGTLD